MRNLWIALLGPFVTNQIARDILFWFASFAKVAELADAPDLGSGTERCGGSSPPFRTKQNSSQWSVVRKPQSDPTEVFCIAGARHAVPLLG